MSWISVKDSLPKLNESVLIYARSGFYFPESRHKDDRTFSMFVGFFYEENYGIKKIKPEIKFEVECGCSGAEFDREHIDVLFWMHLPEPPKG